MNHPKIYFTLLVYLKPGKELLFNEYESLVLPLLPEYNGKLEMRIKNEKPSHEEVPDEIHIISFPTKKDFENYRNDERRNAHADLFKKSVERSILLKGKSLI